MPKVIQSLPDNSQSVTRPVILSVIQQLQTLTKIPSETKIFYPGETARMSVAGSTIDSNNRDAQFNTDRITFIEAKEDYDVNALASTATRKREHIPVFIDDTLGFRIVPVYSTTNISITIKYRGNSETEVKRWYDDLRMRIVELKDINIHGLQYHYPLTVETLLLIKEIYTKKETIAPHNESLEAYINRCTDDRLTLISDTTGTNSSLVIQETQCRVVGLYDFDGQPEKPERDDSTGTWSISFDYKFNFEKPVECCFEYPVMVHNQLLEAKYIDFRDTYQNLDHITKTAPVSIAAFSIFETTKQFDKVKRYDSIIRVPEYDDFYPKNVPMGTGSIMTLLSEVDTTDARTLFNLTELGDVFIDHDILEFIQKSEYPYIGKFYHSIIQLHLYRNDSLIESGSVLCDSNLNVKTNTLVDYRRIHRVRFGLVTDLTMLTKEALDRLRQYPKAFVKIIAAINELLANHPDFVDMGSKRRITQADFDPIYRLITGEPLGAGSNISLSSLHTSYGLLKNVNAKDFENYRLNSVFTRTVNVSSILSIRA